MIARLLIFLVRVYQKLISPLKPPTCRYYPTCSSYAVQALHIHGALKGSYLSVKRILKCHPLFPGGYDPVPPATPKHKHTHNTHKLGG